MANEIDLYLLADCCGMQSHLYDSEPDNNIVAQHLLTVFNLLFATLMYKLQ